VAMKSRRVGVERRGFCIGGGWGVRLMVQDLCQTSFKKLGDRDGYGEIEPLIPLMPQIEDDSLKNQ